MKQTLIVLLLALFFVSAINSQTENTCTVRGRIVDNSNNFVANSYVHWYPSYAGGIDHITVFSYSGGDGKIEYSSRCPIGAMTLYATSSLDTNSVYTPLLPPFAFGSKLDKQVRGLPVPKYKSGDLELGNVKVQVYYSTAKIQFISQSGAKLLPVKKDWENANIRFRDAKGIIHGEKSLSAAEIEKFVDAEDGNLIVNLPVDDWRIEIQFAGDKKEWLKPDKLVSVKRSEDPVSVTLMMDKNNPKKLK